MTISLCTIEV